eukprot:TRINITY_DN2509_c0_g1_i2.p1 TRINITY_DN2509_c0_g1~~TRINITY_DN2509_c0_g1_i2.p1  ORF type:complete len:3538 (+),score=1196.63 TRINITY_DN2509_c0_g1_i2:754-10614(+)
MKSDLEPYLLHPISATLRLKMNLSPLIDLTKPRIVADCDFPEIKFSFSENQYHTLLALMETMNQYTQTMKYLKYRPNCRPSKGANARLWWRYATQVILERVKKDHEKRDFGNILKRIKVKNEYCSLWKRASGVKWHKQLSPQDKKRLDELEDTLSFEDIIFFRSVADIALAKEADNSQKRDEFLKKKHEAKKEKSSWFSFGRKKEKDAEPKPAEGGGSSSTEEAVPEVALSPDQEKELFEAIGYNEAVAEVEPPKEYVVVASSIVLSKFVFCVQSDYNNDILRSEFTGMGVDFKMRSKGMTAALTMNDFLVLDNYTSHSKYGTMLKTPEKSSKENFLSVIFDSDPLLQEPDKYVDTRISVGLKPLEITITRPFIDRMISFFTPKQDFDVSAMMELASEQVESQLAATRAQLEVAVQQHKTVDLDLHITAPTFVIPQFHDRIVTPLLVLDLGKLTMKSKVAPKKQFGQEICEADFYDSFALNISNVHLLVAVNDEKQLWRSTSFQKQNNLNLVEEFDLGIELKICIYPNEITLTKMMVKGELPQINVSVSPDKFKNLMNLINTIAPTSEAPAVSSTTPKKQEKIGEEERESSKKDAIIDVEKETKKEELKVSGKEASKEQIVSLLQKRKDIEASFVLKKLNVTLVSEKKNGVDGIPLARFKMNEFSAGYVQRMWDMSASARIGSMCVEDCFSTIGQNELISSIVVKEVNGNAKNGGSMLSFDFLSVQRTSPAYAQVDSSVSVNFGGLLINCKPTSISMILDALLHLQPPTPQSQSSTPKVEKDVNPTKSEAESTTASSLAAIYLGVAKGAETRKVEIKTLSLTAKFGSLEVSLNEDSGSSIAKLSIANLACGVDMMENGNMSAQGMLGNFSLQDLSGEKDSLYKSVISVEESEGPMVSFKYKTFKSKRNYPGHDESIEAVLNRLKLNLCYLFISKVSDYFLEGPIMKVLNEAAKNDLEMRESQKKLEQKRISSSTSSVKTLIPKETDSSGKKKSDKSKGKIDPSASSAHLKDETRSKLKHRSTIAEKVEKNQISLLETPQEGAFAKRKINVSLKTPEITIPMNFTSTQGVYLKLGDVIVSNSFKEIKNEGKSSVVDVMTVKLCDMMCFTEIEQVKLHILERVEVNVNLERSLDVSIQQIPQQAIDLKLAAVDMRLSEKQIEFLMKLQEDMLKQLESKKYLTSPENLSSSKVSSGSTSSSSTSASASASASSSSSSSVPASSSSASSSSTSSSSTSSSESTKSIDSLLPSPSSFKSISSLHTMVVSADIGHMSFDLLRQHGTSVQDNVANFLIDGIMMKMSTTTDEYQNIGFSIGKLVLSDTRVDSTALYKYMLNHRNSLEEEVPIQSSERSQELLRLSLLRHVPSGALKCGLVIDRPHVVITPSLLSDLLSFVPLFNLAKPSTQAKAVISSPQVEEEEISDQELLDSLDYDELAIKMKAGIALKMRGAFKKIPTFKGVEAIDYLCDTLGLARESSLIVCSKYVEAGFINPLNDPVLKDSSKCICEFKEVVPPKDETGKKKGVFSFFKKDKGKDKKKDIPKEKDQGEHATSIANDTKAFTTAIQFLTTKEADEEMALASVSGRPIYRLLGGKIPRLMSIEAEFIDPEITIIEDETRSDSLCLDLKSSFYASYENTTTGLEEIHFDAKGFQLFVFQMNNKMKRKNSRVLDILSPTSVHVDMGRGDLRLKRDGPAHSRDIAQQLSITISKIELFFSYSDLKLLLSLSKQMTDLMETLSSSMSPPDLTSPLSSPSSTPSVSAGSVTPSSTPEISSSVVSKKKVHKIRASVKKDSKNTIQKTQKTQKKEVEETEYNPDNTIIPLDTREFIFNETLSFKTPIFRLTLINDFMGRNIPLLEIRANETMSSVTNWSTELDSSVSSVVCVEFFNDNILTFEPFIEDWPFSASFALNKNPKMSASLKSFVPLNLNVSHSFLTSLARTVETLSEDYYRTVDPHFAIIAPPSLNPNTSLSSTSMTKTNTSTSTITTHTSTSSSPHNSISSSGQSTTEREVECKYPSLTAAISSNNFHSIWATNKTGLTAFVWSLYESEEEPKKSENPLLLPENDAVSLDNLKKRHSSGGRQLKTSMQKAQIVIGSAEEVASSSPSLLSIDNCSVERLGLDLHTIKKETLIPLVTEVGWNIDGSKLLTLRTNVQVKNSTNIQTELLLTCGEQAKSVVLEPEETFAVPVQFLFGSLTFRPVGSGFFQNPLPLSDIAKKESEILLFKCQSKEQKMASYLNLHISATTSNFFRYVATPDVLLDIHPPLCFQNELPVDFSFEMHIEDGAVKEKVVGKVRSGESLPIYSHSREKDLSIFVKGLALLSSAYIKIEPKDQQRSSIQLDLPVDDERGFKLMLHGEHNRGKRCILRIFATHWIINKSYLPLQFVSTSTSDQIAAGSMPVESFNPKESQPFLFSSSSGLMRVRIGSLEKDLLAGVMNTKEKQKILDKDIQLRWSTQFSIKEPGVSGMVTVEAPDGTIHDLKVRVEMGSGMFYRTKLVTFSPYTVVVNRMSQQLRIQQASEPAGEINLAIGEVVPLCWKKSQHTKANSVALRVLRMVLPQHSRKLKWSSAFGVTDAGEFVVKMRADDYADDYYARVEVKDTDSSTYVIFTDEDPSSPPFKIENDTAEHFQITISPTEKIVIGPNTIERFCFSDLSKFDILVESVFLEKPRKINLAKIKKFRKIEAVKGLANDVFVYVRVSGATRILTFTHNFTKYRKDMKVTHSAAEVVESLLRVDIAGLTASLITQRPMELTLLSIGRIESFLEQSDEDTKIELKVHSLQVDSQDPTSFYPIFIRPVSKEKDEVFFHFSCVKSNKYTDMDYFTYLSVMMQELNVEIDYAAIYELLGFYTSLPVDRILASIPIPEPPRQLIPLIGLERFPMLEVPLESPSRSQMKYNRLLLINPIKVNVTFQNTPGKMLLPLNPLTAIIQTLIGTIANIDHAPLCINALMLENSFCSSNKLTEMLTQHFVHQIILEVYKVLGSTDLLGNPLGLFTNIATGVSDFFFEPFKAKVLSPKAFGKGLARGTGSLVKNSVYGIFNTVSKFTGAIGKGVATLSMDDDYLKQRRLNQKKQPKHIGDGALQGVQALGMGIFHGISGIVTKPVEGAKSGGFAGFAKGLGKGIVGVAVKPVAGVFEFATKTTEGIRNTANIFDEAVKKVRPFPRAFGENGQLLVYNEDECEGQFLLSQSNYPSDFYVFHAKDRKTPKDKPKKIYLATKTRLLILDPSPILKHGNLSGTAVEKDIPYHSINEIDYATGCIALKDGKKIQVNLPYVEDLQVLFSKIKAGMLTH